MYYFEFHFQKIINATKGWKDDEFGAYVRLLMEQFDRGYVPDDPEKISRLITSYKKNWPLLKEKFTEPSEPGQLRNTFMVRIRNEAMEKRTKNAENGSKGGLAKKANALAIGKRSVSERSGERSSERGSQPVTSNQEPSNTTPKKEESVKDARPDLTGSNLFKKPKIPTPDQVLQAFVQNGGTEEMAKKFFETNEATGWFYRGSPIMKFISLVPGYIAAWKERSPEVNQNWMSRL